MLDFEVGYVVTPMAKGLRLTTGAEFARLDDPPSAPISIGWSLLAGMFPLGERREPKPWLGRRPCLPDMLPIIGPAPRHKGLWFDFGHQHLGLTLGPSADGSRRGDDGRNAVRRPGAVCAGRF